MARTDTLGNFLTDVADAIREKKGTSETIQASQFDTEIANLPSGGDLDWSAIGYNSTPKSIADGYNYAKYIQENWIDNTSKLTDFPYVVICPMVSLGNRTNTSYFGGEIKSLIEIPLIDTSNITNMGSMFANNSGLKTIPLLDTSNVTNMDSMFQHCSALTEIPLLDTSKVTSMQSMFQYCSSLKSIPQINTSNVTSFANTFRYCTNLMTLPVLNTSKVTNFNNAFGNCYNLTDTSLDNILQMCINATAYTGTKTLKILGISNTTYYPVSRIEALPHYQDFIDAGWTIGY